MKLLLINENATVNKLVTLSAQKVGFELTTFVDSETASGSGYGIVIVDNDVVVNTDIEVLRQLAPNALFYVLLPKATEKPSGYDKVIDKPFLPTELVDIFNALSAAAPTELETDGELLNSLEDDDDLGADLELDSLEDDDDLELDSLEDEDDLGSDLELGSLDGEDDLGADLELDSLEDDDDLGLELGSLDGEDDLGSDLELGSLDGDDDLGSDLELGSLDGEDDLGSDLELDSLDDDLGEELTLEDDEPKDDKALDKDIMSDLENDPDFAEGLNDSDNSELAEMSQELNEETDCDEENTDMGEDLGEDFDIGQDVMDDLANDDEVIEESSVLSENSIDELKDSLEDIDAIDEANEETEEELRLELGNNQAFLDEEDLADIDLDANSSIEAVKEVLDDVDAMDNELSSLSEIDMAEALGEEVATKNESSDTKPELIEETKESDVMQEAIAGSSDSINGNTIASAISNMPVSSLKELLNGMELTIKIRFPDLDS